MGYSFCFCIVSVYIYSRKIVLEARIETHQGKSLGLNDLVNEKVMFHGGQSIFNIDGDRDAEIGGNVLDTTQNC